MPDFVSVVNNRVRATCGMWCFCSLTSPHRAPIGVLGIADLSLDIEEAGDSKHISLDGTKRLHRRLGDTCDLGAQTPFLGW